MCRSGSGPCPRLKFGIYSPTDEPSPLPDLHINAAFKWFNVPDPT